MRSARRSVVTRDLSKSLIDKTNGKEGIPEAHTSHFGPMRLLRRINRKGDR